MTAVKVKEECLTEDTPSGEPFDFEEDPLADITEDIHTDIKMEVE